ncbi:MAG: dTDP-4-dehydrorhamnose 3,5-epimerase family protein [Acidobacteria bacterium]|nr:dTDP-4-dehydrorhamnose 3,5-epimerase family protein [Acidobacteriota bacterium]
MLDGVVVKDLVTHTDERGFFREIIRVTDDFFTEGFGQWSHSMLYTGVVKAWHLHKLQVDWWFVPVGVLKVALHDTRPDSPTYRKTVEIWLGDHQPARVMRIPPGVAHGCKCICGPAHLFYITSKVYNPSDEIRVPYDAPAIGYDWLKPPEIK